MTNERRKMLREQRRLQAEQDRERKPFLLEIQSNNRLSRRFLVMNQSEYQKLNELLDMFILSLVEQ